MPRLQSKYFYLIITDNYADVPPKYREFVFDKSKWLTGSHSEAEDPGVMIDRNREMLTRGWEKDKLQRVWWSVKPSDQTLSNAVPSGTPAKVSGQEISSH